MGQVRGFAGSRRQQGMARILWGCHDHTRARIRAVWTQKGGPAAHSTQSDPSPWARLSEAEIRRVVADGD